MGLIPYSFGGSLTLIGGSRDRRRWPRVPIQINVTLSSGVQVLTVANLRDISSGGGYIEMQGPLNPAKEVWEDQRITVRFLLPGATAEIALSGRVARLERESPGAPCLGLGVEFLDVPTAAAEAIETYITSLVDPSRG